MTKFHVENEVRENGVLLIISMGFSPGISPGAAAPLELLPEIQYTVKRSCSSSQWI